MTKLQKSYQSLTSTAMKAEMLEPDVELDLARRWHRDGCEKSLHRLVNAYMRLAVSMASKYVKYGVERCTVFNLRYLVDQSIYTRFCSQKLVLGKDRFDSLSKVSVFQFKTRQIPNRARIR